MNVTLLFLHSACVQAYTCSSILSLFDRAKVPVETQSQVILARRFTGEDAQRAGIVHEVCPAADVTDRALAAAATLTRGRPHQRLHRETLATIKRHLYSDAYSSLSNGINYSLHKSKL